MPALNSLVDVRIFLTRTHSSNWELCLSFTIDATIYRIKKHVSRYDGKR